ncbi:MAG: hypothetical protein IJR63_06280 [Synergistaceae bacterium]|nr:hypothetical protein [Synergistaceae bacterium]
MLTCTAICECYINYATPITRIIMAATVSHALISTGGLHADLHRNNTDYPYHHGRNTHTH